MPDNSQNNKRIAKNTIFLYFRMFFGMCVSLYTSRIILNVLGVEDYGIYSVVAGVIALFGFLTSSMSSAVARFLSFELGKYNFKQLRKTFSSSLSLHIVLALIIVFLAETIGLWFLKEKLVIPINRLNAALWVFHVSILTTFCSIVKVPFLAVVFSNERMGIYAIFEIVNVVLKLILIIWLQYITTDKLIIYALILLSIELISLGLYVIYGLYTFKECNLNLSFSKKIITPILYFTGWDFYGNMSVVARTQGVNMLLNIFFGPLLNAAGGIATQIQGAINSFSNSILVAVRPQIVKSYASGDISYTLSLLDNSVRLTSLLLLIIITPLVVDMDYVLKLWLGNYPNYTVELSQLTLLFILLSNISAVVMSVIHATGKIKKSSILNGTLYLMVIPLSYLAFQNELSPIIPFLLNALFVFIGSLLNSIYLSRYIESFKWKMFLMKNILPLFLIATIGYFLLTKLKMILDISFIRLVTLSFVSIIYYCLAAYVFLLPKAVKGKIMNMLKSKLH